MVKITEIEKELRRQVVLQQMSSNATINSIRQSTEEELGLDSGYIKSNLGARSKEIINEEFTKLETADNEEDVENSEKSGDEEDEEDEKEMVPAKRTKSKSARKPSKKSSTPTKKKATKSSPTNSKVRTKTLPIEDSESDGEVELKEQDEDEDEDEDAKHVDIAPSETMKEGTEADAQSDSEMSILIDDGPPLKSRKSKKEQTSKEGKVSVTKKESSKKAATKGTKQRTSKKAATDDDDPKAAEVKKLQSQLVRCGVRKIWGIYLKPYETSSEKITHLKSMLKDVGMDGRYSQGKAKKIRAKRELQEELQSITQSNIMLDTGRSSRSRVSAETKAPPPVRKRPLLIFDSEDDNDDDEE